jgi:hypothetical protein
LGPFADGEQRINICGGKESVPPNQPRFLVHWR